VRRVPRKVVALRRIATRNLPMAATRFACSPQEVPWAAIGTEAVYVRVCLARARRGEDVRRFVGEPSAADRWLRETWRALSADAMVDAVIVVQPALPLTAGAAVARVGDWLLIEGVVGLPGGLFVDGRVDERAVARVGSAEPMGPRMARLLPGLVESGLLSSLRAGGEMYEVGFSPAGLTVLDHGRLPSSVGYEALGGGRVPRQVGARAPGQASVVHRKTTASVEWDRLDDYTGARIICDRGPRLGHLCTYAASHGYVVEFRDDAGVDG